MVSTSLKSVRYVQSTPSPFAAFNIVFMAVLVVLIVADCVYLKVTADRGAPYLAAPTQQRHQQQRQQQKQKQRRQQAPAAQRSEGAAATATATSTSASVAVVGAEGEPHTRAYYDEARQKDPSFGRVFWATPRTPRDRPRALLGGVDADACSATAVEVRDTGDKEADDRARALLCTVYRRSAILLDYLKSQLDNGAVIDFPEGSGRDVSVAATRLIERHRGRLVLREYHNPDPEDMVVALNVNKGEELAVCVRNKLDITQLNCVNTMMRVVLHEFAHTMDAHYRMNAKHGPCFDRLADFLYLLGEGIDVEVPAGGFEPLYHCPYSCDGDDGPLKTHIPFCGLSLPRSHCPSDADPSPTAVSCDDENESPPSAAGDAPETCMVM
jgi:hypothetical protein